MSTHDYLGTNISVHQWTEILKSGQKIQYWSALVALLAPDLQCAQALGPRVLLEVCAIATIWIQLVLLILFKQTFFGEGQSKGNSSLNNFLHRSLTSPVLAIIDKSNHRLESTGRYTIDMDLMYTFNNKLHSIMLEKYDLSISTADRILNKRSYLLTEWQKETPVCYNRPILHFLFWSECEVFSQ